jgi:hypothetical protein
MGIKKEKKTRKPDVRPDHIPTSNLQPNECPKGVWGDQDFRFCIPNAVEIPNPISKAQTAESPKNAC